MCLNVGFAESIMKLISNLVFNVVRSYVYTKSNYYIWNRTLDPVTRIVDPGSWILDPMTRTVDPGS